ncbi:uncharacterized protein LOC142026061 isoform X3 [Buteo buteo]|uniref:uncharacterized protein LOC142026061 isoform X3 n=1 Tax=Buteo buteo TaxID=30397 RepID=UPI003EBCB5A5
MLIIMEVKVDLETTHCHVRRSSSRRSRCSQRTSSTLDVHHHGGQGAPGEPPPCWTFIVTESGCSRRMSPRWMFLVTEIKVLQENLLRVGRSLSRSQGAPGEPHHVGRSSSRTSRCSRRTSATLDVHRHGLQGALGEPPPCWTFIVTESGCSGRTSPRRTFIITDFKVLQENLRHVGRSSSRTSRCSRRTSSMLDVHRNGGQGAPGELRHVGRSLSRSQGAPGECHHVGCSSSRKSRCSGRTSSVLDVHCHGVRVLRDNLATSDVHRHGLQGAPGEPPPRWTFIVTDFKVLQENLRHVGRSSSRSQGAPGEPRHVGCSSSWKSRCSRRTSSMLDVHRNGGQGAPGEPRHVGRSSSRTSRCSRRTSATSDVHCHGVRVLQENVTVLDVPRHGNQGAPGEPSPRRTFIVTEVRVLLDTGVPYLDIGVPTPPTGDIGVPDLSPPRLASLGLPSLVTGAGRHPH